MYKKRVSKKERIMKNFIIFVERFECGFTQNRYKPYVNMVKITSLSSILV